MAIARELSSMVAPDRLRPRCYLMPSRSRPRKFLRPVVLRAHEAHRKTTRREDQRSPGQRPGPASNDETAGRDPPERRAAKPMRRGPEPINAGFPSAFEVRVPALRAR